MIKINQKPWFLPIWKAWSKLFNITYLRGGGWGNTIYLARPIAEIPERVFWHELVHIFQQREHTRPAWLFLYGWDWCKNLFFKRMKSYEAYRAIRWEVEAYSHERPEDVLMLYPRYLVDVQSLKVQLRELSYNG